jgi:hypothetical protein
MKKAKTAASGPVASSYYNLEFIPLGTIQAESFFSTAKFVLSDHRRRLLPITFEQILFLKYNRRFWDMTTVHEALGLADTVDDDYGAEDDDEEKEEAVAEEEEQIDW